jgi:hypothetical protein
MLRRWRSRCCGYWCSCGKRKMELRPCLDCHARCKQNTYVQIRPASLTTTDRNCPTYDLTHIFILLLTCVAYMRCANEHVPLELRTRYLQLSQGFRASTELFYCRGHSVHAKEAKKELQLHIPPRNLTMLGTNRGLLSPITSCFERHDAR